MKLEIAEGFFPHLPVPQPNGAFNLGKCLASKFEIQSLCSHKNILFLIVLNNNIFTQIVTKMLNGPIEGRSHSGCLCPFVDGFSLTPQTKVTSLLVAHLSRLIARLFFSSTRYVSLLQMRRPKDATLHMKLIELYTERGK